MTALLAAGVLSMFAIGYAFHAHRSIRRSAATPLDDDPLEAQLSARQRRVEQGLWCRNVEALGRAGLFGGTACAVWELAGGSAHYLSAGVAFGLGLICWMVCGEIRRRIGSMAEATRSR